MGFILDAIGAAAGAGGDILADQRKADAQLDSQRALSADAEQRQMRLAEYNKKLDIQKQQEIEKLKLEAMPQELAIKSDAEDATRKKRAKELGDAQTGLVKKAMVGKLDGFYADGKQRTVDSVSDDELNIPEVQLTPAERSNAMRDAGVQTGQLSAKDALADDAKGETNETRFKVAQLQADLKDAKNDMDRRLIEAKIEKLQSGGGSGDKGVSREERLRYTSLFSDAGRRLSDAQKALAKVMPGRAGEAERTSLNADITQYKEERAMYQRMLAESQSPQPKSDSPAPATDKPKADKPKASEYKRGDTKVIAAGPNKGKTAVYDGTGWALK